MIVRGRPLEECAAGHQPHAELFDLEMQSQQYAKVGSSRLNEMFRHGDTGTTVYKP